MDLDNYTSKNINNFDSGGYTPIGRACETGNLKRVKQLLQAFPTIDLSKGKFNPINSKWNLSALDLAKNNPKIIKCLMEYDPTSLRHETGVGPVFKSTGLTEILMNQGVGDFLKAVESQNASYQKGASSALKSSIKQHTEADTICLLQKNTTLLRAETGDKNELCVAITANNKQAVEVLLQNNPALVDKPNSIKQTSVHYAARKGTDKILELLLKQSPDLNALDERGFSPLDYAAKEGHVSTAALLIKYGAVYSKLKNNYNKAYENKQQAKMDNLYKYIAILDQAEQEVQTERYTMKHIEESIKNVDILEGIVHNTTREDEIDHAPKLGEISEYQES